MSNLIYFVTTSSLKFNEAQRWCAELIPHIRLEQAMLEIPEIQSLDAQEIAVNKARAAWDVLQQPLIVDDSGLYLDAYPLFPGTLTKFVRPTIGVTGLIALAGDNRKASYTNCLVYMHAPDDYITFSGTTYGTLVDPVDDDVDNALYSADVFVPEGHTISFSTLRDEASFKTSHFRYISLKNCAEWIIEYSN
jgi:XTP/dITP diphosphohydrolase